MADVERDNRLKNLVKEALLREERKKQEDYRNQERVIAAQKRAGKAEAKGANAQEKWQKVEEVADRIIESGQQGYDSWVASMSQVCILMRKMSHAIRASDPFGSALDYVVENVAYPVGYLLEEYKSTTRFGAKLEIETTSFSHLIEFKDDNTLDIDSNNLARSDGKPVSKDELDLFKSGIMAWFKSQDCNLKQGALFDENDYQLTKDDFEYLRDDPERGLNAFLGGHFEMDFEPTNSPRP